MKNVKITTIILAIILVVLVGFAGVYVKTQNRMEDKVKEYDLGRDLKGERIIELKITDGSDEGETAPSQEDLTVENYETVKNTLEKRLKNHLTIVKCCDRITKLSPRGGSETVLEN